ncbi:hypothetical protein SAMN05216475_4030 [Pseudomonas synxantha]|uniref:Uncharacterized protein n=1 Tax=Pseudomonas synxantha TaxID=47883 RepID=A0AAX3IDD7_9PSED|nr:MULTISPECIES: hypothetical protein [Pseudomonas]AZE65542.1 hypothetical protein C4K01_1330 [Pseudomonas synxantha]KRP56567.1 hypothetical protein TU77_03485 [Pseudomonas synxantha]SDU51102.1 hypothetical protein SAMN05216475_4030 [Pseudomonas synxantha]VTR03811.1 Uncharacterised protein [Pseudomonas synxantha]
MFDLSKLEKNQTLQDLQAQADSREARAYLASTDWYSLRFLEENTPIPENVLAARAEARGKVLT